MFKLTTKQKLTLFFIVVLVTGLISINVFMFYYMEARRLENEKNSFKAKNIIDLKAPTTTTTEKPFCQHNTVWIGHGLLNRWTAMSPFLFLTRGQHEAGTWDPNYAPRVDFLDHNFLSSKNSG